MGAEQLSTMGQTIRDELQNLKSESTRLTQQLSDTLENLKTSEEERKRLKTLSTELSTSLTNMTEQLQDCTTIIAELRKSKHRWMAATLILSLMIIIRMIIKIRYG